MESFTRNNRNFWNILLNCKAVWVVLLVVALAGCGDSVEKEQETEIQQQQQDDVLQDILEKDKLIALTDNSATSYFIYRGQPMGYEYELLDLFANYLGVDLEIKVVDNIDELLDSLEAGKGHIAAANLTVTSSRKTRFLFSEPHLRTKQVLIQKMPDNFRRLTRNQVERDLIRDPVELANETVYVRTGTSFYDRLINLSDEIGDTIHVGELAGVVEADSILAMVSSGQITYSIEDENVARFFQPFYPNVDIQTPVSFSQNIAWALPKRGTNLLDTVNKWITAEQSTSDYAYIYNKYFKWSKKSKQAESTYSLKGGGMISPYDNVIKQYANKINWDWPLLASVVKQESNFDPNTTSWAGAVGLMQVLPATAIQYGVDSHELALPEPNIFAGTQYMDWIENYWKRELRDTTDVIKFTLASYNVGLGHVKDARRLAEKYDKDPDKWDNNVAAMLLKKSNPEFYQDEVVLHGYCRGVEPYNYVKSVYSHYDHYSNFVDEK